MAPERSWTGYAGAWLGIGTAPGALLVGAGLALRHGSVIPLGSLLLGLALIAAAIWIQGHLGLLPPLGEGANLTQAARRYFTPAMGRILAGLIAIGMTGWFGVNVGMGASAFGAMTGAPRWAAALLLGVPITGLALRGIRGWNRLAALATLCVLVFVGIVLWQYDAASAAVAVGSAPLTAAADMASVLGYVGVFCLRAPDFTAGLRGRRELAIVTLLLIAPLAVVVFAGAVLGQHSGSADLITVLAGSGGLAIGNLLIVLAVIAPTFTTLYSGAPALHTALGIPEQPAAMLVQAAVGLALAAAHFDGLLLPWLGILGALLPPVVVPLAVEFVLRHRAVMHRSERMSRTVPVWPWLAGMIAAGGLLVAGSPLAMVGGFVAAGLATLVWQVRPVSSPITTRHDYVA